MITKDTNFCSLDEGYYHQDNSFYSRYTKVNAPPAGIKIHISVILHHTALVAYSTLPKLQKLKIFHKITRTSGEYEKQLRGNERGKFISIYARDAAQAQEVVKTIEPDFITANLIAGPTPRNPVSRFKTYEIGVGRSGLLFMRYFTSGDGID